MTLEAKIEALLFSTAEPMSLAALAMMLDVSEGEAADALAALEMNLAGRGIVLVRLSSQEGTEGEVMLATAPGAAVLIETLRKEALSRDLGKAALETLTIILYRGPLTRGDIDYIRGVNSSYILRNLRIRGLVEKVSNPTDVRGYLYKPTFDLLNHLGISSISDLPGYGEVVKSLEHFEAEKEQSDDLGDINHATE